MSCLKKIIRILPFLLLISQYSFAQYSFERAETEVGTLGFSITNFGTIGKPDVRNNPESGFSMRYPKNTGTEHLFEGGLWIGAQVGGAPRVSTGAVSNPSGYARGKEGYEFSAEDIILKRSTKPDDEFYSTMAVSEGDIITRFSDRRREVSGTPISKHENPLYADVKLESYSWGFPFTENFTIVRYDITNKSDEYSTGVTWDSVYVGMYADLVVRNVNSVTEVGTDFFNKNGLGYIDSLQTVYAFDAASPDNPSVNSYGAITLLGGEYRDVFFHPNNPDTANNKFIDTDIRVPKIGPSYWAFGSGAGNFNNPNDDVARYSKMAEDFPYEDEEEKLRTGGLTADGNYMSFISMGPYPKVEPGETITIYFVISAALKPDDFQSMADKKTDTEETRAPLVETIKAAQKVFQGEDKNNNGKLDPGEDTDGDGKLTRYLFPTPPDNPKMKIELESGKVNVYWDRSAEWSVDRVSGEEDFEGYRVYSTELGDDLNPSPKLIREFDIPNNNIGFDTGFDEVKLDQPVFFDNDTTEYWYKYELDGLLNGWQYMVSVTAFDRGDEVFGVESLETSTSSNSVRVFPGTQANENFGEDGYEVGVYPNPYRVNAAWDGPNESDRKLYFYNLPAKSEIRIYTIAGDIIAELEHDASTYNGDISWFSNFSDNPRIMAGGEHAWDLQTEANQILTTGLYLFTVKDLDSGKVQTGKLAIIK